MALRYRVNYAHPLRRIGRSIKLEKTCQGQDNKTDKQPKKIEPRRNNS
uniref:Uncharacterized protein n=1 Tax=Pseudomonas fluorescens (strain SBW25) TaxID=216595 RepID=A0A0G4E5F8_PSEFS|nr:hypothetical protein PQBR55_0056 [Pseudomonas fluorescens SBW25]